MVYQVCNRLDEVYSGYMTDLIITQIDSVHIKIDCERALARELNQFFTFTVPNYQFTPAYKNKTWDGQIRLYNLYKRTLYAGLLECNLSCNNEREVFTTFTYRKWEVFNNILSHEILFGYFAER